MNLLELLKISAAEAASDLHISAGLPPIIRVDGDLKKLNFPVLSSKEAKTLLYASMTEQQCKQYETDLSIDFSFYAKNIGRFRVNLFQQQRGISAVFRLILEHIRSLDDLKMPAIVKTLCHYSQGLILVTGPTGSGKTTTLAAMVDEINMRQAKHILTIEDPIEFVHTSKQSLIQQRELYRDTPDFNSALRAALREDPNIIFIGELRDLDSIRLALTAAETGHLVLASLHTASAAKTINRIIDVFSGEEKQMMRSLLSESLQAVISQILVKKIGGGRTCALEIMLCTSAIRHLIRENKIAQIMACMQTGASLGMNTLDQHLKQLVDAQVISPL